MKPIKLTITNIGPFVGTHAIDFTKLENIYVITGKTGSGKTTILDAITYALYGELPGAKNTVNSKFLRSHFCEPTDPCSIILEFSIQGKTYKIDRKPPYQKTNTKGKITETKETVELYSIAKTEELISSQKATVEKYLQDLLLLTIEEFSKIVLLPQGEFSEFLKQNSTERKKILAKLFPMIEQFTKIIEKTKQKKDLYQQNVDAIANRINQLTESFNPETAETDLANFENQIKNERNALAENQAIIEKLIVEKEKIDAIAQKIDRFENAKRTVLNLEQQKEIIAQKQKTLSLAHEVDKILPLVTHYEQFIERFNANTSELEQCTARLENVKQAQKVIQEQEQHKATWDLEAIENTRNIEKLETALNFEKSIAQNSTQKMKFDLQEQACVQQIKEIEEKLAMQEKVLEAERDTQEKLAECTLNEKVLQHELLVCEKNILDFSENLERKNVETQKNTLQNLKNQFEEQKTAHLAQTLAQHLVENCPCPVCGATEHPAIARAENVDNEIEQKITLQENVLLVAEQALQKIEKLETAICTKIEMSANTFDATLAKKLDFASQAEWEEHQKSVEMARNNVQVRIQELQNMCTTIENAKLVRDALEKDLQPQKDVLNAIQREVSAFEARIHQAKEQLANTLQNIAITNTVQETIATVKNLQKELLQTIEAFTEQKTENDKQFATLSEKYAMLEKSLAENKAHSEKSFTELLEAIKKTDFYTDGNFSHSIEFVKKSVIDDGQKIIIQATIDDYNNNVTSAKTIVTQLEAELNGQSDDIAIQQAQVAENITQARGTQADLQDKIEKTQEAITHLTKDFAVWNQENAEFEKAMAECEKYTILHKAISGGNAKKVALDAWILSMYLHDIVNLANGRLDKLSNGRYELRLLQEETSGNAKRGLDLEIFDQYTGHTRPTSSLSGGETFMTAICLALAISDLVQQQNGGVQLDSLFIDEGFGSLDPESLESALGILDEIRETRSIGLISHVEMLQTRIPSQICVIKTSSGSEINA